MIRFTLMPALWVALGGLCTSAQASSVAIWPEPDLASYTYPFVGQRANPSEPTFGQYNSVDFVGAFDNRDGQIQFAFDTDTMGIPTGEPLENYQISAVTLTVTVAGAVGNPLYDPTYDSQSTYPLVNRPASDPDAGRPVELYAAEFRNGYTGWDFSPTVTAGPPLFGQLGEGYGPSSFGQGVRHVFPTDLVLDGGVARDVSNNLDEPTAGTPQHAPFDPTPLAVGVSGSLVQGAPLVDGTVLTFEIDVQNPLVLDYVREGLQKGELGFIIATLLPASGAPGGGLGGNYAFYYLRGNGSDSPSLTIAYDLVDANECVGDINGDGSTNLSDFNILGVNFGSGPGATREQGDLNGDGFVDLGDFNTLGIDFGCTPSG